MFFNSDLLCKICFNSGSSGSLPSGVCQGEPVPELPDLGFLRLGNYPIAHRVYDALFPALLKVLVDGGAVPVGALGYLCQGQPEGFPVKMADPGRFGGQGHHLVSAGVVCPAAFGVIPSEAPGFFIAVPADAGSGAEEVGEGHGIFSMPTVLRWKRSRKCVVSYGLWN